MRVEWPLQNISQLLTNFFGKKNMLNFFLPNIFVVNFFYQIFNPINIIIS